VAVRDGDDTKVEYKTPFASPPRLVLVEMGQGQFKDKPYHLADFGIVKQEATFFTIENHHPEKSSGSWATIKWRAEGIRAEEPAY
jgi:hypothetical protein